MQATYKDTWRELAKQAFEEGRGRGGESGGLGEVYRSVVAVRFCVSVPKAGISGSVLRSFNISSFLYSIIHTFACPSILSGYFPAIGRCR